MNRYQEALHYLSFNGDCNDTECKECSIKDICHKYSIIQTLQEAIDKANKYDDKETPKKTIKEHIIKHSRLHQRHYCFICKQPLLVLSNYCGYCGNSVDWSDENDKILEK